MTSPSPVGPTALRGGRIYRLLELALQCVNSNGALNWLKLLSSYPSANPRNDQFAFLLIITSTLRPIKLPSIKLARPGPGGRRLATDRDDTQLALSWSR